MPRGRLVQSTKLLQIVLRLAESPLPSQCSSMEIRQFDTPSQAMIHLQQRFLHTSTFRLPEAAKGCCDAASYCLCIFERESRFQGSPGPIGSPLGEASRVLEVADTTMCKSSDV